MMPKPLLAEATNTHLERILRQPPHALLLTGPAGIGKRTIGLWLIEQLKVGPQLLEISPEKDKNTIGIEAVRAIEQFTALRVTKDQAINRIVFIPDAELLTPEAQNALLKTLEEPPAGTLLLLTAANVSSLLPTVRSRLQIVEISKPKIDDLEAALCITNTADLQRCLSLSGGLPGLAFALAHNDQSHPLVVAAQSARDLLQGSTFSRLASVDTLSKNKQLLANLLYILLQMSHVALLSGRSSERWQKVLTATYTAESDLQNNMQPKLALTKLMLNL